MKWRPRFRLLHLFGLTLLVAASLGWLEYVKRDRAAFVEMQSLGCYFRAGRDQHFDEIYHPHLDRFNPPPWSDAWDDSESDVVHGRSWGRWLSERCRPPSWNAGTLVVERGNPLSIAAKHAERLGALKSVKVVWVGLTADDLDRLSELPGYRSLQLWSCWAASPGDIGRRISTPEIYQPELWRRLRLPARLERLDLDACPINDEILQELLGSIERLKTLRCFGLRIGDGVFDDPSVRRNLRELKSIDLRCTDVTDLTAQRLAEISSLEEIVLYMTRVTDAGLSRLARLPRLRSLNVDATYVSQAGLAAFRREAPHVTLVGPEVAESELSGSHPKWLYGFWIRNGKPEQRFGYEPGVHGDYLVETESVEAVPASIGVQSGDGESR